ncbi:RpiR family transcriptional regulator [Klebsiella pneumoniae]|uniref:RpiR family transcriptional regulator n=1 Tax=Klebsiella pneumoniae TaxID=573 RepID=A0A4P0XNR4_KLEPN|nr:RpiR family transcriptional regulator [Klebsiella pneumoniae]
MTLAALLQHQLLPSGIAINLCQDAALMRLTASTLNDDHLLLVLATAEANPVFAKRYFAGAYAGSGPLLL